MGSVDVDWRISISKEVREKRILLLTLRFYNINSKNERESINFKLNFFDSNINYKVCVELPGNSLVRILKNPKNIKYCQYILNLSNLIEELEIPINNNEVTINFRIEDNNYVSKNLEGLISDILSFSFNLNENDITTLDNYEIKYELPWIINWYKKLVIGYNNFFNQSKFFHGILGSSLIYNEMIIPIGIENKKVVLSFTLKNKNKLTIANCNKQIFYIQHLKIKTFKAILDIIIPAIIGALISLGIQQLIIFLLQN